MVLNKRKKNTRMRGSCTHGYGAMKKHRGAGSRGGRGMAGTGKRADQKKPSILKKYGSSYFGKKGFKNPRKIKLKFLNLEYIDKKLGKKEGGFFIFDASKYDKILSKGNLTKKVKIKCKSFSKSAINKIKGAGGEAIICS